MLSSGEFPEVFMWKSQYFNGWEKRGGPEMGASLFWYPVTEGIMNVKNGRATGSKGTVSEKGGGCSKRVIKIQKPIQLYS